MKQQLDQNRSQLIWHAFGSYISKTLALGKGVQVPKFGQFTFSAPYVDLAGTTNPDARDRQERIPVFLSAFCRQASANAGGQLRPFELKGSSGIIPQVKINYFEVATLTGGQASKDLCKTQCEMIFKKYEDRARKGETIQENIPKVGRLVHRNGMAAVIFEGQLVEKTLGQTAKGLADKLFATNNFMNNKIYEKSNPGVVPQQSKPGVAPLNVSKPPLLPKAPEIDRISLASGQRAARRQLSNKENSVLLPSSVATGSLEKMLDRMGDSSLRKLARSNRSSAALSVASSRASFISQVPELAPFQLMNYASGIYQLRQKICENVKAPMSLRDQLSSSKILQILQKTGYRIEIGSLKAVLKELGFNWNGSSCSITQLLARLKEYLNSYQKETSNKTAVVGQKLKFNPDQKTLLGLKLGGPNHSILEVIKELLFSTKKPLYHIFKEVVTGNNIDFEGFMVIVNRYSNYVLNESEVKKSFLDLCTQFQGTNPGTKDYLTFLEFHKAFTVVIPDPEVFQDETRILQIVQQWMALKNYSSDQMFEFLLTAVDRSTQKSFKRYDFQKALVAAQVKLTAPEIDYLFDMMTGFKQLNSTLLGYKNWCSKITDQSGSALSVLRNIIKNRKVDKQETLKILDLQMWDNALDYPKFQQVLRRLSPSLSDHLLENFFERIKSNNGKVEIPVLIGNICGDQYETIDYKQQMFKELYIEIFQKDRQKEFIKLCEKYDKQNEGRIEPKNMQIVIMEITRNKYDPEQVKKFVGQLTTNPFEKIQYLKFLDSAIGLGNKNHNPFKYVVQKIEIFMQENKLADATSLLKRIGAITSDGISNEKFANFLKEKIEKTKTKQELENITKLIDVDKDGFICSNDLYTCIKNLDSEAFYKDGGKALEKCQFNNKQKFFQIDDQLDPQSVVDVIKQIRSVVEKRGYSPELLFKGFDSDSDGMLTIAEFTVGINSLLTLSPRILERVFGLMDTHKIGMVDFENFQRIMEIKAPFQVPKKEDKVNDGFEWQNDVIKGIRRFVKTSELTPQDAFRLFDQDFDGQISKSDMKLSLQKLLGMQEEKMDDHKISRLFAVLSFYKTAGLQPSDFDRLLMDINPFLTACQGPAKANFKKALGGGLMTTSTHDWKLAAIQQVGMVISRKYQSIEESFKDASQNQEKVNFVLFKQFIEKHNALEGFNMTRPLLAQLFAELDPHKKTFLSFKDWVGSFGIFNENDVLLVELKNYLQCQFADAMSAYNYFLTFGQSEFINFDSFSAGIKQLIKNRVYKEANLKFMYNTFLREPTDFKNGFNFTRFQYGFDNVKFKGRQSLATVKNPNNKGGYVVVAKTATNPEWEKDIIARLRATMAAAGKSVEQIFAEMDEDGNGTVTSKEFRNAMRKLSIGLKSKEIDQIMQRIDENGDGVIDYQEFFSVLGANIGLDKKMVDRANNKLAQLKEAMQKYMSSHGDAYRKFDQSKVGKMTYSDFSLLVTEICRVSGEQEPSYAVIKDLFDAVDMKKDGHIDQKEWNQTFNTLQGGDPKSSIKPTPLSAWDNSEESNKIGEAINRHRKNVTAALKALDKKGVKDGLVTFPEFREALKDVLYAEFKSKKLPVPSDAKLKQVLKVGQIQDFKGEWPEPMFDFMKIVTLFKERYKPVV